MTRAPIRIQRSRAKGWKMPEGAVYVGRPTMWGNPFTFNAAKEAGYTRRDAAKAFDDWLQGTSCACGAGGYDRKRQEIIDGLNSLRGKDLMCWCPLDQPCHADTLLRMANE